MKKMMFNDRFGLTDAVIEKRKTVTRRVINPQPDRARHWNPIYVKDELMYYQDERGMCQLIDENGKVIYPPFKVGEIVAIAQKYERVYSVGEMYKLGVLHKKVSKNKMFVRADLMPHQIRIIDVRAENLQAITDDDCLREGIIKYTKDKTVYKYDLDDGFEMFPWRDMKRTPQEAFAALIDKISGKGTWDSNPFVWRIEFEYIN